MIVEITIKAEMHIPDKYDLTKIPEDIKRYGIDTEATKITKVTVDKAVLTGAKYWG